MTGFIFGGNTPWSYDELQKKRTIAEELVKANMSTPRNVGEGLNAIGRALAFRSIDKKASKRDAELKGEFQSQWDSAFGGFGSGASGGGPAFAPPAMPAQLPPADPNEALAGDAMAALGKPAIHDHGSHPGQSHADWLKYSNQGATRNDPLDPGLVKAMAFLPELGVTMEVFSGGQEAAGEGGSRTGSTRHDHGKAADAFFYKDGVRLDPNNPAHVPILQEIVKRGKAAGVTGWGAGDGYMQPGSVHLGFGAPAVWGAGGSGANAAPWLVEAYNGAPASMTAQNTSGGGMDLQTIAELAGSPYATPGQKAVLAALMQQQMDAMDPMRAIEMQKAQLELAQMQNPEPEPGFTRLTAEEVAGLGLPPGVYQRGPDGRIDTIEKTQGPVDPIADLKARAAAAGLQEGTPEFQQFMLNNGKTPEGMVIESDGQGGFRMVQGAGAGTAAAKPFTEGQSKDVVYATRAQGALEALEPIAGTLTDRGDVAAGWLPMGLGGGMQNPDYQVAKTAGDEFLQAILRKDTGAAITADEQVLYGETYLPRPGDTPERLAYKSEARKRAVAAIEAGMSPAQIVAQERALQQGEAAPASDAPTLSPEALKWLEE